MNNGSVPDQGQRFLFASGACFFIGTTVVLGQDSLNERMRNGLSHEDHGMMATIGARGAGLFPPSASEFPPRQSAATAAPCTAFAAVRITSSTSLGLESIGTWLLSTS